jgi:hypothetical protein
LYPIILKNKIYIFFLLLFILLGVFLYQRNIGKSFNTSKDNLSVQELELIKEGDIILRRGYGWVSDAIQNMNSGKRNISHCGIIVKHKKQWHVIHTISGHISKKDGVQIEPIYHFTNGAIDNSIIILRPQIEESVRIKIINKSFYYLSNKTPFDNSFSHKDSLSFYCTEFIHHIISTSTDENIFSKEKWIINDVIGFEQFFDQEKFKMIINHQK